MVIVEGDDWMTIDLPLEPGEIAHMIPGFPVLVAYRGSIAHGTYVAPDDPTGIDDKDIMAAYVRELDYYLGLQGGQERGTDVKIREWDCASYELRHYVRLALGANPNVLSLLWTPPIHATEIGKALIANRHLFASKLAYHSFGGYAMSQLKRMTAIGDQTSRCGCAGDFHERGCKLNEERGRGSTKRYATGFMGAKRKALVEKFGYDTKNAAHLLRLLAMGIEFLTTGEINVDRTGIDSGYLIDVKVGRYSLDKVQGHAEYQFRELEKARDRSPLPDNPDHAAVQKLLVNLLSVLLAPQATLRAYDVQIERLKKAGGDATTT
jgi:uncharacterized protein